jgi:hypothetical protein
VIHLTEAENRKVAEHFRNQDLSATTLVSSFEHAARYRGILLSSSNDRMIAKSMKGETPMRKRLGFWTFAPVLLTLGLILFTASAARADIIVDNDGPGTSYTGTWYVSSGSGAYGVNSLYSKVAGATYTYSAALAGTQKVSLWWTAYTSRCTSVKVQIYNGSTLLATKYVNQQGNGSMWNVLGTYSFSGTAKVKITATGTCSTCADAVKFSPSTGSTGDTYEPDDTPAQAKTIYNALINPAQVQNRSIHAAGNVDWAKFTLTQTTQVTITTNGSAGDTEMWLYGPNNSTTLIQYDDDSGNGYFSMIQRTLAPGNYYIKVAEYQNNGTIPSYTLSLAYPFIVQPLCNVIPPAGHWKGEYFNNKTLSGSPVMTRDDGLAETDILSGGLSFNRGPGSPSSTCGVPAENYSVRWTVNVNVAAGNYDVLVGVDDGVRLWMNGQMVINQWFDHSGYTIHSNHINLPGGSINIKMEYYNRTGAAQAILAWEGTP